MSASITYASTPIARAVTLTTGDTSRAAPTTFQTVVAAAAIPNGMQIERFTLMPQATDTATVVRFWAFKASGSTWRLLFELALPAATVTGSSPIPITTAETVSIPNCFPKIVEAGEEVRVSVNDTQAGGVWAMVEGGGY